MRRLGSTIEVGSRTVGESRADAARQSRLLYESLQSQLRAERHLRLLHERRGAYMREAGASHQARAAQGRQELRSIEREANLQGRVAQSAWRLGLEETAYRALHSVAQLERRFAALSEDIARSPYLDALETARAWDDRLAGRIALLRALEAPEEDVLRLTEQRVGALEREAQALRALGEHAKADRALALAARLAGTTERKRETDALDERVRRIIGVEPRHPEAVAPLAVARVQDLGGSGRVSVREDDSGGERRFVVEFRAPKDAGNALADAIVSEVMARLGEVLRSAR